jgi:predicted transglutaminase-like cysteine proteinase
VVFILSLTGIANTDARTDFGRMEQLAATEYGQPAAARVKLWRTLIENNRTQPELAKLERANTFFNHRVLYASDMATWGVADYWTTPLELLGKGAGDCEDYAIAKYISLRLMDVPVQKLRLVYVRARLGSQTIAHMVLSYFETPTADPLILDNLVDVIHPASRRPDLFPVYSFNHEGLWMEGERASSGSPTARLSRWRDVLQRMRAEGIDPSLTTINARSAQSWKKPKPRSSVQKTAKSRAQSKEMAKPNVKAKAKKTGSTRTASTKLKTKTAKYTPPSRRIAKR